LFGIFSLTLAREEGLEINLFGLVYGIKPFETFVEITMHRGNYHSS